MAESPELVIPTGSEGEDRRSTRRRRITYTGQLAGPSQTLMSLVDEGDVWVVANLKETQLDEELRPGMSVEVAIDTRVQRADTTAANPHALVDR